VIDEEVDEEEDDESPKHDNPQFWPPQRRKQVSATFTVQRSAPASSSTSRAAQGRNVTERKSVRNSSPPLSPVKPTAGKPFTEEDTELLDDAYEDILNLAEDQIIDAWVTWAENVR
jgi:hypothetical protein